MSSSPTYNCERYVKSTNSPLYHQLTQYLDYCKYTRNFTKATMRGKISSLNHFAKYTGILDMNDLTNAIINQWMMDQNKAGLNARTVNNRRKHLIAMIKYLREYGVPVPNVHLPEVLKQKEITPKRNFYDRAIVYEALKHADREAWLMIKIAFDCGLRINELRHIQLSDINGNRLRVLGKGGKYRNAIMSDEVMERLRYYIEGNSITDYLWPSRTKSHTPILTETIRRMMRKPFMQIGIKDFKPHDLRHSYATDLKKIGVPTRLIQMGLGHSSELTTERYLHDLDSSDLDELYFRKYTASSPKLL